MQARARLGQHRRASLSTSSPIEVAHHDAGAGAGRRAERPAGDGADVLLELRGIGASMVQWPELWTRGAISLTSSASAAMAVFAVHEHLDGKDADRVQPLADPARDVDRRRAAVSGDSVAGTTVCRGCGSRCSFSQTS
jgi:hypothetical protein